MRTATRVDFYTVQTNTCESPFVDIFLSVGLTNRGGSPAGSSETSFVKLEVSASDRSRMQKVKYELSPF